MLKKINIINGFPEAGKDTFVKLVSEYSSKEVINLSTIDPVKTIAKTMGWSGAKESNDRKFLSNLKDLWRGYNNHLFMQIVRLIKHHKKDDNKIIFLHVREPDEINDFKKFFKGECTTILIDRKPELVCFTNHADSNVYNYDYDIIVDNNKDIDNLKNSVKYLIENKF